MKLPIALLISACLFAAPASAVELVFAVSAGSAMPMTEFKDGVLTAGLLKEFGDALARELHYEPRYLVLPRKRVESALVNAQADLLCDMRPEWLDGSGWMWTDGVFNNTLVIASLRDTPLPTSLAALSDVRVGSVLGYRYPEIETLLGRHFIRDETTSEGLNLDKLVRRRFKYMVTNTLYFDYQRARYDGRELLNPNTLKVRDFETYCVLPPGGKLNPAQVNRAIGELRKRGEMQSMLDKFRPGQKAR